MGNLLLKLFLAFLGGLIFLVALLFLSIYTVWALLRWLITGKKPQVTVVWQQYNSMRRNFRHQPFSQAGNKGRSPDANVVDVEARELTELTPRLPPTDKP